jgi:predicted acyltransferase (DUF342 family)
MNNYMSIYLALKDCTSGDIIKVYNGLVERLCVIGVYINNNNLELSFNISDTILINNIINTLTNNNTFTIGTTQYNLVVINGSTAINYNYGANNLILSGNTQISGSLSTTGNLTCSGETLLNGSTNVVGNMDISGNITTNNINVGTVVSNTIYTSNINLNGNATVNTDLSVGRDLFISRNTYIYNNLNIAGTLDVGNNTLINGNTTINGSTLLNGNVDIFGTVISNYDIIVVPTKKISVDTIQSTLNALNIISDTINIGNSNSIVNINGQLNNMVTSNLEITDNVITINKGGAIYSSAGAGIDIEENKTIVGYIRVSPDRSSYYLKAPAKNVEIIVTKDFNGSFDIININGQTINLDSLLRTANLDVSLNSILHGTLDLYGNFNINNNFTVSSISGNTNSNGNLSILGNFNVNNGKFIVNSGTGNTVNIGTFETKSNLIVNTDKFIVNSSNGNLDMSGNLNIYNKFFVNSINGNLSTFGSIDCCGNTTIDGMILNRSNTRIVGNLDVSSNTTIDGLILNRGNTRIVNNLDVSANTSIDGTLLNRGNTRIVNNLDVSSNTTIDGTLLNRGNTRIIGNLDISANTSIDGTLLNRGNTRIVNNLDVSANTTIDGSLLNRGNTRIVNNLDVSANTTIDGTLLNRGNTRIVNNLDVSANTTIDGTLLNRGNTRIVNNLDVSANTTIDGTLLNRGNTRIVNNLDVSANTTIDGMILNRGNTRIVNNLDVSANTTIDGMILNRGNTRIVNNLDCSGNTTIDGNMNVKNLFILNKGNAVNSGANVGFLIEENKTITGYIKTSSDRTRFLIKPPNNNEEIITSYPNGFEPTNINAPSTLVKRDNNGNFSASIITADLSGTSTNANNINVLNSYNANNTYYLPLFTSDTDGMKQLYRDSSLYYNPLYNTLYSYNFIGDLSGNATNARYYKDTQYELIHAGNIMLQNVYSATNATNATNAITATSLSQPANSISTNSAGIVITNNAIDVSGAYLKSIANIGINMVPSYPLDISGFTNKSFTGSTWWHNYQEMQTDASWNNIVDISVRASNRIMCGGVGNWSDERIKRNIKDIDSFNALDILRQIEPKQYNYIDKCNKGNDRVWGFIAQQVDKVLPYSVTKISEFIPNIYKIGKSNKFKYNNCRFQSFIIKII